MTDSSEYKKKIQELVKQNKITLLYYNNVNNISQWNYKITK